MTLKSKIFTGLSSLWALFIFSNSFKPGAASEQMSNPVVVKFCGWFDELGMCLDPKNTTFLVRKSAHFIEFFILGLLISLIFVYSKKRFSKYTTHILFLCLLGGVIDEFIQSFVVGRSSDVRDVVLDFAGAFLAFCIIAIINKVKSKSKYRTISFR